MTLYWLVRCLGVTVLHVKVYLDSVVSLSLGVLAAVVLLVAGQSLLLIGWQRVATAVFRLVLVLLPGGRVVPLARTRVDAAAVRLQTSQMLVV